MKLRKIVFVIYKTLFIKIMKFLIILGDIFISFPRATYLACKSKENIPPITDSLLLVPAIILARKIREREVTSETLVRAFITRIGEVNSVVNAIVENRFATAIEEAKKTDETISRRLHDSQILEQRYPLLGVPITIKEAIAVSGMSHSAGMICSRRKAHEDADVVKKLKDAGAIILAVTNTPELCSDWECYNKITGRTSNPYDNRRTSGGSSGGEAALISSAASIIGIGSDALGSLRLPAHFCGIFCHKPTPCLVPTQGHFPMAEETIIWQKVISLGPMTRYSIDLALLLKVICKDEIKGELNLDKKVDYSKVTIFYLESWEHELVHPVIPEIVQAIHKTTQYFRKKYNTQIQEWQYSELFKTAERSLASLISIKGMDDIFQKNPQQSPIMELIKFSIGLSKHTFFPICYLLCHRFLPFYNIRKAREKISMVEQSISTILGNNGVLICPTFPIDAPYHGELFTKSYNNIYMSTFNSLGLPVTVCPVGTSKKGLPIGLQIVSGPYLDYLTIGVAEEIEKIFGGWKSPE